MAYRLYITYPDGHVEEIEEEYSKIDQAKNYAIKLLTQVAATEKYHYAHGDWKGIQKRGKASYMIVRKTEDGSEVVFDSKKDQ